MASWRMFCTAAPVSRWQRLKSSKAAVWCRSLVSDYKEACREALVAAWERPLRTSLYLALMGGAGFCMYTRPDWLAFRAAVLERSNQLALLSPWIRNATSDGHVQSLMKLSNEGRLHIVSMGVLSLIYRSDYNSDTMLYEAQCSNLAVPWRELPQRVLDVGFTGRWWILDSKMKDYDINEEEFKYLPTHMQATLPPSIQEVEQNERLHKESLLPVTMQEEETEKKAAGEEQIQS